MIVCHQLKVCIFVAFYKFLPDVNKEKISHTFIVSLICSYGVIRPYEAFYKTVCRAIDNFKVESDDIISSSLKDNKLREKRALEED